MDTVARFLPDTFPDADPYLGDTCPGSAPSRWELWQMDIVGGVRLADPLTGELSESQDRLGHR